MFADNGLYARLLRFLNEEARGVRIRILSLSLISGAARTAMLVAINGAAAVAGTPEGVTPLLLASFLGSLVVYMVASYDSGVQREKLGLSITRGLRLKLTDKLMIAHLRFFDASNISEIYTQIGYDIRRLADAALTLISGAQATVLILCALVYLGWLSPLGLGLALVIAAIGVASFYWLDVRTLHLVEQTREQEARFFGALSDVLDGSKELRIRQSRRADLAKDLEHVTGRHLDLQMQVSRITTFTQLSSEAFMFILIGAVVFVVGSTFSGGSTSVFQFLSTILFIVGPIETLVSAFLTISRARIALRMVEVLEAELDAETDVGVKPKQSMSFQTLALKDVHFTFQGDMPDRKFEVGPINLELHRGEVLFIVGGNGAGKTTLLKLLTGLYRPDAGAIMIDGRKIEPGDMQNYREMFSAVFSDFHLFRRVYGMKEMDLTVLDPLLKELQLGHKTKLEGDRFTSINLSTGQRKRLAYAIDRLFDRQIFVFDEFGADQDPEFRKNFYLSLVPQLKREGKTVVAVTHDDRWFDVADRLVKMDYGQVVAARLQPHPAEQASSAAPARAR